jgi:hypothetical protein
MWNVGDRVLAHWYPEPSWWYPGTIQDRRGGDLLVAFDDGDRAWVGREQVKPLDVAVGSRVYGRWRAGRLYYPGTVTEKRGEAIHIAYDDGDREWTTVSFVRVDRGAPAGAARAGWWGSALGL